MERHCLSSLLMFPAGKTKICIDDIAKPFRKDLLSFIVGETFMREPNDKLYISRVLYDAWIKKLCDKGFDEDIDLKIYE